MTWNIRKHRRGNECTEHLYSRLVSWESSHRRQCQVRYNMQSPSLWECAVCSVPDPKEMDNASSFFSSSRKAFRVTVSCLTCHPWSISEASLGIEKKHTGRGRFPLCVAPEVLQQILGLISSYDFLDTTGACLLVIRPLDNLPQGGKIQLNEQWNNFMWPWTALTAWCVVQNLKKQQQKNSYTDGF